MKIYTFLILFVVALSSCAQNTENKSTAVTNLSQKEFKAKFEKQENLQLLDVRTPQETASGKIGNAKELNVFDADFTEKIASLDFDKAQPIVIYCKSGARSSKAANIFAEQGFTQIYNLVGGYSNY